MFALLNKKSYASTKINFPHVREFHKQELPENPNYITEPEQIFRILNKLKSDGLPCCLKVNNKKQHYITSLIKVHAQEEYIILDEITSDSDKQILTNSRNIKLSVFYNEINLSFNLNSLELVSPHNSSYYKAALPKRIYYPQRRESRRISVNSDDISFQGICTETQMPVCGIVNNISRSGIGATFHNNSMIIRRDKKLTDCQILLPNRYVLNFDLSIRFAKTHRLNRKTTRIGGYFENISPDRQKNWERYVAMLERKEIRKLRVNS